MQGLQEKVKGKGCPVSVTLSSAEGPAGSSVGVPMFQRLSPRLVLISWRGSHLSEGSEKILKIRVDKAFPPTHPTTRLCLELLREPLAAGQAATLLDLGCGAGVLGLAGAAQGVPLVVGLDLARGAVQATLKNARKNLLAGPLQVVQGSTECLKGTFDLVVANLPWEVQMDRARELDRLTAPAGCLILSGFRESQENLLQETYQGLGWCISRRAVKDFRHPELPPEMDFTWVAWILCRQGALVK
jgi:ribosomal protein L11 methylase PrmA